MTIEVQGIEIEIVRKRMKNMRLCVVAPDGKVRISAPIFVSNEKIRLFATSNLNWIRTMQMKLAAQPRPAPPEFVSGETLYIWGKPYSLRVEYSGKSNHFVLEGTTAILTVRRESTAQQRAKYVDEVLRQYLNDEISRRLPVWEQKTGLRCKHWIVKKMKTRWGTYSVRTGRISFSLQLAHKPIACLEYVIAHELGHIKHHNHGKGFIAYMDNCLPDWRLTKKILNVLTVDIK